MQWSFHTFRSMNLSSLHSSGFRKFAFASGVDAWRLFRLDCQFSPSGVSHIRLRRFPLGGRTGGPEKRVDCRRMLWKRHGVDVGQNAKGGCAA